MALIWLSARIGVGVGEVDDLTDCLSVVIGLTEGGSLLSLSWEELELLVAGPGLTLGVHPEELTDAIVVAVGYTGWEGSTLMGTVVTMVAR